MVDKIDISRTVHLTRKSAIRAREVMLLHMNIHRKWLTNIAEIQNGRYLENGASEVKTE